MATVPANKLLRDSILKHDPDARMPAILEDADWATWLSENDATPEQAKAVLRTMEGVKWSIAPELKKAKDRNTTKARAKPENSDSDQRLF
jgi:putative SOS response-associated peptidase YedK